MPANGWLPLLEVLFFFSHIVITNPRWSVENPVKARDDVVIIPTVCQIAVEEIA